MEGLINVDVSETSNQGLVEQCGLDHSAGPLQPIGKDSRSNSEGIRPQSGPEPGFQVLGISGRKQASKPAGIDEVEFEGLRTPDQVPRGMPVAARRIVGGLKDEPTRHSKPDHEPSPTCGGDVELFSSSLDFPDRGFSDGGVS